MRFIQAIVREERVPFIQKALGELEIYGMTIRSVMGRGEQKGLSLQFRGGILGVDFLPKVSMEIVVQDQDENAVVQAIEKFGKTGKMGDGRIFVMPLDKSVRVRSNEVEV
ncbi:MAG TPA: P-II family nitrogen regulator [Methanoregulaceae archaeon]|nr:P-II family nitrogen regulator [Methanoregulaceae archaeon]